MANDKTTSLVALRDCRERVIARLSDAFAHDDLGLDEFELRLGLAHRSDSIADLEQLTGDLTGAAPTELAAPVVALAAVPAPGLVRDRQTLVAVLGGTNRQGQWTPPRKLRVVAVLGGAQLDFRHAALSPGVTEVAITAVLGGVEIIVPPQLAVEMDGVAVLGGFEHSERAPVARDPDRPILRVRGVAVLGGVNITTRLPGESEREQHRRQRALAKASRRALPAHEEE